MQQVPISLAQRTVPCVPPNEKAVQKYGVVVVHFYVPSMFPLNRSETSVVPEMVPFTFSIVIG